MVGLLLRMKWERVLWKLWIEKCVGVEMNGIKIASPKVLGAGCLGH